MNWDRQEIFEHYRNSTDPFWSVTYREDISAIRAFARRNRLSFYLVMIWAVTEAVNAVDAFHYTIRGGQPAYLERRLPSFTILKDGRELFQIVTMDRYYADVFAFCRKAEELAEKQDCFLDTSKETDELVYISTLPWLDVTSLTNEGMTDPDDSIPRIAWGRYTEEKGKTVTGISFEVNHRLIDGIHIALFSKALKEVSSRLDSRSL